MTEKFHKAARDGYIPLLQQASRRDMNCADEDGMTPVHWAAFNGHLQALRVTVGRGGDPNKADIWGDTSLHYAARKSHMECVTFLANFGANLWTLDNDGLTPMDVAAMNGHEETVRYLDGEMGRQMALNPKDTDKKKSKAISDAQKRSKKWVKFTEGEKKIGKGKQISSMCQDGTVHINPNPHMAALPPGTKTTLRNLEQKFKQTLRISKSANDNKNKASHLTAGGRSFSDYVMTSPPPATGATTSVIKKLTHRPAKDSQLQASDIIYAPGGLDEAATDSGISDSKSPEPPSLFERPGFGSVAFRSFQTISSFDCPTWSSGTGSDSTGSDQQHNDRQLPWTQQDDHASLEAEDVTPLETFLCGIGLSEYLSLFTEEHISLDSLVLLTNDDLNDLNLPMGPRRILLDAINTRIDLLNQPGDLYDIRF